VRRRRKQEEQGKDHGRDQDRGRQNRRPTGLLVDGHAIHLLPGFFYGKVRQNS